MGTKLGTVGSTQQFPFLTGTNGIGTPNQTINPNGSATIICGSYPVQPYTSRLVCEGWMKVVWTGLQKITADASPSTPTVATYSSLHNLQWQRTDGFLCYCDVPIVAYWASLPGSSNATMRVTVTVGSGPSSVTVSQVMLMWRESRL